MNHALPTIDGIPVSGEVHQLVPPLRKWTEFLRAVSDRVGRRFVTAVDPHYQSGVVDARGVELAGAFVVLALDVYRSEDQSAGGIVTLRSQQMWIKFWHAIEPGLKPKPLTCHPYDLTVGEHVDEAMVVFAQRSGFTAWEAREQQRRLHEDIANAAAARAAMDAADRRAKLKDVTHRAVAELRETFGTINDGELRREGDRRADRALELDAELAKQSAAPNDARARKIEEIRGDILTPLRKRGD